MKWIVIVLVVLAVLLLAVGKWTRMSGRSADERAGSDIPYLLAGVVLVLCVGVLVVWALIKLFF